MRGEIGKLRLRLAFSCHHPPPGLAFGEPDDRLQRVIQYPRDVSDKSRSRGVLDRPVKPGDDRIG
jgi:hypothetical protein